MVAAAGTGRFVTKWYSSTVDHASVSSLAAWESFYVIVGSSAAALTGLQFVVMALIAETRRRGARETVDAFGTPTILHFAFVLLLASILTAPWPTSSSAAIAIGACGVVGVGYVCIVSRRTRRQTAYQPVLEDWIWHIALPLVAYAALTAAAFALRRYALTALFVVGAASLLLLFVGIHNAWDSVTYIIFDQPQGPERE
jgi:hypothetical protein